MGQELATLRNCEIPFPLIHLFKVNTQDYEDDSDLPTPSNIQNFDENEIISSLTQEPEQERFSGKSKSIPDLHKLSRKMMWSKHKKRFTPAKPKFLERLINGVSRPRLTKNGKSCSDESGGCLRLPSCDCDGDCTDDSKGNVVCARQPCHNTSGKHQTKCIGPCCSSSLGGRSSAKGGNKRSLKWHQQQTVCLSTEADCECSRPDSPSSDYENEAVNNLCLRVGDTFETRSAPSSPNCKSKVRHYAESINTASPNKRSINRRVELLKRLPQRNAYLRDQKFANTIMAKGYVKAMIEMINHTDDKEPETKEPPEIRTQTQPREEEKTKSITISPFWNSNSFVKQIQSNSSAKQELSPHGVKTFDSSSENGHDNDTGFNSATESHMDDTSISSKRESGERSDAECCYLLGANGVPQSPAEIFDNSWSDSENIFESDFSEDSDSEEKQPPKPAAIPLKQDEGPDPEDTHPGDKLFKIVHELVKTERAYVNRLHLVDQVFHFKVTLENNATNFLPADVIPQMFSNIKSIYQLHNEFVLPKLEERLKNWDTTPRIGDLMKHNAPFLKLYTDYVKNFDRAMTLINQWYEKSPKFAAIMQEIQKLPECGNLSMQHHMLEPIQRIPRYELLLKEYIKHLSEDSPDRKDTQDAVQLVATAATHSNEAMNKIEKFRKLLEIHQSLGGSVDLISPTRELIKEGRITKISARREKTQERYIFLFNDIMLICSEQILGTHKVRAKLDIDGMQIMEGDNVNIPFTFKVTSKQKIIEFQASSTEESDDWKSVLWEVVRDFTTRKESLRKGQFKHLENNGLVQLEDAELGKRAPQWVRDEAVTMCMLCTSTFTTFRRRHHCRACGIVVCSKCSSKKASLNYDDKGSNRVCDTCHKRLKAEGSPEQKSTPGALGKRKKILHVKGSDPSVISGYLSYTTDKGKNWTRRWFAAHSDFVLYFFKAHQDVRAMNSLPLPGYQVELLDEKNFDKPNVFKLHHKNQTDYCFQAENKIQANKWVRVLEKVVLAELPEDVQCARLSSDSDTSIKSEKSELSDKPDETR